MTTYTWTIESLYTQTIAQEQDYVVIANYKVLGVNAQSGNFNASVILGRSAAATGDNQFVVGSVSYPAGAVATETVVSDRTWAVIINGTAYKILLKA